MKISLYYSYFPHGDPVDWEAVMRRVAALGAECVELSSMRLVEQDRSVWELVRAVADELGLGYTFCTSLPAGGDVSSDDAEARRRGIDFIQRNIETVAAMGGSILGGMLHGSTNRSEPIDNGTLPARLANSAAAVREMAEYAASRGVRLGLEMCNRFENTMLNTVEQGLEFLGMVDCANVGLHLDSFHMNIEEDDLAAAIMRAGKRIVHFHASENNRKLPGMGRLDWREILLALGAVGYRGALSAECFAIPHNVWTNNMCLWRDYVRDGIDEDAAASIAFLKAMLEKLTLR